MALALRNGGFANWQGGQDPRELFILLRMESIMAIQIMQFLRSMGKVLCRTTLVLAAMSVLPGLSNAQEAFWSFGVGPMPYTTYYAPAPACPTGGCGVTLRSWVPTCPSGGCLPRLWSPAPAMSPPQSPTQVPTLLPPQGPAQSPSQMAPRGSQPPATGNGRVPDNSSRPVYRSSPVAKSNPQSITTPPGRPAPVNTESPFYDYQETVTKVTPSRVPAPSVSNPDSPFYP